jgi:hypothetical protein
MKMSRLCKARYSAQYRQFASKRSSCNSSQNRAHSKTLLYNFIFQAIHDDDHYLTNSDFSLAGEIATYNATAKRAPSLDVQKILYSESVLRPAAYIFLGRAPISKIVFP